MKDCFAPKSGARKDDWFKYLVDSVLAGVITHLLSNPADKKTALTAVWSFLHINSV